MRGFAQLMMRKTEIVGTSDQIHPRLKRSEATGSMAGFARQAGKPFPEGSIQALDKSCVEDHATLREQKQFLCLGQQAMGHPSRDLDNPLFLRPLDHCANVQLWPDLQTCSPNSTGLLDLLSERSTNTVGIGRPAVCQDEQGCGGLGLLERTCDIRRSARLRSRDTWTTPATHRRVETIMASPIQAIILHPFTRISSA